MSQHTPDRVCAGTPDGGQFATTARAESGVSLSPAADGLASPGGRSFASQAELAQLAKDKTAEIAAAIGMNTSGDRAFHLVYLDGFDTVTASLEVSEYAPDDHKWHWMVHDSSNDYEHLLPVTIDSSDDEVIAALKVVADDYADFAGAEVSDAERRAATDALSRARERAERFPGDQAYRTAVTVRAEHVAIVNDPSLIDGGPDAGARFAQAAASGDVPVSTAPMTPARRSLAINHFLNQTTDVASHPSPDQEANLAAAAALASADDTQPGSTTEHIYRSVVAATENEPFDSGAAWSAINAVRGARGLPELDR